MLLVSLQPFNQQQQKTIGKMLSASGNMIVVKQGSKHPGDEFTGLCHVLCPEDDPADDDQGKCHGHLGRLLLQVMRHVCDALARLDTYQQMNMVLVHLVNLDTEEAMRLGDQPSPL